MSLLDIPLTSIDDPRSFHDEARWQRVCASCGRAGAFEAHHAVQKQKCRRERAPLHSPDNSLRVCSDCHGRHTNHQACLPVRALRDENIAFAVEWLGAGPAYIYFTRHYSGTDPRLDELLEQL